MQPTYSCGTTFGGSSKTICGIHAASASWQFYVVGGLVRVIRNGWKYYASPPYHRGHRLGGLTRLSIEKIVVSARSHISPLAHALILQLAQSEGKGREGKVRVATPSP